MNRLVVSSILLLGFDPLFHCFLSYGNTFLLEIQFSSGTHEIWHYNVLYPSLGTNYRILYRAGVKEGA